MVKEFESQINGIFNPEKDMPIEDEFPRKELQEISGEPTNHYTDFKKDPQQVEDDWKNQANEKLSTRGSSNRVVNVFWNKFLIMFLMLAIILGVSFFCWGIYQDKFKTSVIDNSTVICEGSNLNVTVEKNPSCPVCPSFSCGDTNVTINPIIYTNSS